MKPLQKTLNLESTDYYKVHVGLVNILSNSDLTSREVDLLAFFVKHGGINSRTRILAGELMGMSPSNISNYLKTLKERNVIIKDKGYKIRAAFYPSTTEQTYLITLVKDENKDISDSIEA